MENSIEEILNQSWSCVPTDLFISVVETLTSISGETKHIRLSGGDNPQTEIKASGGLQECAEEDVSKADAHSAARTLVRS